MDLITSIQDGKPKVEEVPVLQPFEFTKGYTLRIDDLGFSVSEVDGYRRAAGVKISLLHGTEDGAAIDIPPEVVQKMRRWLNKRLFLLPKEASRKKGGDAYGVRQKRDTSNILTEKTGRRKRNGNL